MWSIDELQEVWQLATQLHQGQKYGGQNEGEQIEYINHIGSVAFEILNTIQHESDLNASLALKCAILHDTIEDASISFNKIKELFGVDVAEGVMALTKNEQLGSKRAMMLDSLKRIKNQPKEVWAVKMADRICNLYAPPFYWTNEKKVAYHNEARLIHEELRESSVYLSRRLQEKINAYTQYLEHE